MNKILKAHRAILALVFFLESAVIVTLALCHLFLGQDQLYFDLALGFLVFFILVDTLISTIFNLKVRDLKGHAELSASKLVGADVNEAYNFGQIGIAICDKDNRVLWVNDFLGGRCNNLVDQDIFSVFPALQELFGPEKKDQVKIIREDHKYMVKMIPEARLYIFKDITELHDQLVNKNNNEPVVGYISIDNFADVQKNVADDIRFADLLSKTRGLIMDFARTYAALIRPIKDDRYLFITKKLNYEKMEKEKFNLLERVHKNDEDDSNKNLTVSMGISYGFDAFSKLAEMASSALDVALSRGGDQVVIAPFSQSMIFFGGKVEHQFARDGIRIRTLSNSFEKVLKDYDNIVIMGHSNMDLDALGAAIGVSKFCEYLNIPYVICWDDDSVDGKVKEVVDELFTKEEFNKMFATLKVVTPMIKDNTLLVMVDHNDPELSFFKTLVNNFKHIVIIDHHRPGERQITDVPWSFIESKASSASEMVTSLLIYNAKDIPVDSRSATLIFAGINLDTHSFTTKASPTTFEAAAQLISLGADIETVKEYMKDELNIIQQRSSIISQAEAYTPQIFIATVDQRDIVDQVVLATVADQLLLAKDINASFCIGRVGEREVKISARSNGKVNCQLIMEKMGGGGHLTMAAYSYKNTDLTVEDVKEKLIHTLDDYLDDASLISPEVEE